MVSIVIPTYNEREGIEEVIGRISAVLKDARIDGEIIVVDDDSPDLTWEHCQGLASRYPVSVIRRVGKRGLSSAVIDGWKAARGDILGVMDADGSHDEKILPAMIGAIQAGECDMAIGSRYVKGGGTQDWPWFRIFTSRFAIMLARPITAIRDATSGFCLFKKEVIENVPLDSVGWKIVLEVAIKGNHSCIKEFPFVFRDREKGKSKLGKKAIINYIQHLLNLWKWKGQRGNTGGDSCVK
jgi:dolichol-phosphate mannosyltransferase